MSLESKAKSYRDIKEEVENKAQKLIDIAQKDPDENIRMLKCKKAWAEGCLLESQKDYVSLQDTKAELERLKSIIETEQTLHTSEWKRAMELQSKIEEANKILDENDPKFNEYGHNYTTYDAKDMANLIGWLRDALNANQRKPEQ